jgi:hypothetical protein
MLLIIIGLRALYLSNVILVLIMYLLLQLLLRWLRCIEVIKSILLVLRSHVNHWGSHMLLGLVSRQHLITVIDNLTLVNWNWLLRMRVTTAATEMLTMDYLSSRLIVMLRYQRCRW